MQRELPLKGVNLGGWLILERWMTPMVFEGFEAVDEYTLSQTASGRAVIKKHRDSFITESDFQWLQDNKIEIIRLPIGYWVFESSESLLPHVTYVDWAMKMAKKYKIKVLLDLHGLQGSQNGNDHSGRVGKAQWFKQKKLRTESLTTLEKLAKRYATHDALWGIQVINEPQFGIFHFKLRTFYKRAHRLLQSILKPDTYIIFSDGFTPRLLSGALGRSNQIIMDVHLYHATKQWTRFVSLKTYYHSLQFQTNFLKRLARKQAVLIGEWSGSFRQPVFDSVPVADHKKLVGQHVAYQIDSFQYAKAWFYWSYKTEQPGVWNFKSQVDEGIISIPSDT